MANTSRINGFRPVRYLNGAPWNGQARMYVHGSGDNTALNVGDIVIQHTTGVNGIQAVTRATSATASNIVGVVLGIDIVSPVTVSGTTTYSLQGANLDLSEKYVAASTERYVWVCDDPMVIFEAEFENTGTPPVAADVGLNYEINIGSASTTTGVSGMSCDLSSAGATTNTLPLKFIGFSRRPDNEAGAASARGLFLLNTHVYNSNTGAAGI